MSTLWAELLPLALASMVVPVQWTLTILLLRTSRPRALAFVAGNIAFRLLQGALFFALVPESGSGGSGTSALVSWLLLVVGILLLVKAGRSLLGEAPDDDAPPPRWIEAASTMSTARSFVVGAGLLAIGAKFWVFTMSAVAVIDDADLSTPTTVATFVAFALLAVLPSLVVVAATLVAPTRSSSFLDAASAWLTRNTRRIVIGICLVVGLWFTAMAVAQLGLL
jgi:hypothetical protein